MTEPLPERESLDLRFQNMKLIEAALRRAVRQALLQHKRAGNPIAVWRDGRVALIAPEDIEIGPEQ